MDRPSAVRRSLAQTCLFLALIGLAATPRPVQAQEQGILGNAHDELKKNRSVSGTGCYCRWKRSLITRCNRGRYRMS